VEEKKETRIRTATRARILDAAEALFMRAGYEAVSLRDIGRAAGLRHASLYYYAPRGKAGLFEDVLVRYLDRHRAGLEGVIAAAGPGLRSQLLAIVDWLHAEPPINLQRLLGEDVAALSRARRQRLVDLSLDAMTGPIVALLERTQLHGEVRVSDTGIAAMMLIVIAHSIRTLPGVPDSLQRQIVTNAVDMMLNGWLARD
jgi:AcrR family transcriptional regulator